VPTPTSYFLGVNSERFDPEERAREKQRSRDEDARALASGEKTREPLRKENGLVLARHVRISLRGTKPLERPIATASSLIWMPHELHDPRWHSWCPATQRALLAVDE